MSVLADLRTVAVTPAFRRLFAVRLASQGGDGAFQIGLATLFFFNPEQLATAGSVALAFAVMLLPFTVVGPFVGPLLDRWRRRQVLLVGNLLRVALTLVVAIHMAVVGMGPAVYVLALLALSVNRFLLAALSASLPRVVAREHLTMANSLTPTLGAVSAVIGAGAGFIAGWAFEAGAARDGATLTVAAAIFAVAALLSLRLGKDQLGPGEPEAAAVAGDPAPARPRDGSTPSGGQLRDVVEGARHLIARRSPAAALAVMTVHRFLYGVNFLALLLISRNLLAEPEDLDAGLAYFGTLTAVSFAGNGLAILATPIAHRRMRPATWVLVCLGLSALSQVLMATTPALPVIAVAAVLMGLGAWVSNTPAPVRG